MSQKPAILPDGGFSIGGPWKHEGQSRGLGLGLFGIISQIDWLLSLFGRRVADYPVYVHVIPFLYFVLYTFLIRHALLDMLGAREDEAKRSRVEYSYVGVSVGLYLLLHFLEA